jgi:hypothetical protein
MDSCLQHSRRQQPRSDTTISWSKKIIYRLWTWAFNMWEHCCKLLAEDKAGLKFTKMDNKIRKL